MHPIVIAGAGPTGLMLACELRLWGVEVELLERLPARAGQSRSGGIHARSLELLAQRGLADRFQRLGRQLPALHFAGIALSLDGFDTRYPLVLNILQDTVERLLEERARELGVGVRWSNEVIGLNQSDEHVEVTVRTPEGSRTLRAAYLVGCDGGRSAVRRLAGIGFPGTPATLTTLLADVELAAPPSGFIFQTRVEHGSFSVLQLQPGASWYRLMVTNAGHVTARDAPIAFETFRDSFRAVAGGDYGMHTPRWISSFNDAARVADRYRSGRVLLAGDAAHIHYPAGGQGLNTGLQDAFNLGWKLATVVRGRAGEALLDSYFDERNPVAERVLQNTRAQTVLWRPGAHIDALRDVVQHAIANDRSLAGLISGLDIGYGDAGERVPDLELSCERGDVRLYALLHEGHGLLLDLDSGRELGELARQKECPLVRARSRDPSFAGVALYIRPDGYATTRV